ncbi:alpha/beta fold hydrolase [Cytobacillus massiliigabonensis]|uniref:alpha/beta fold hydrolase n=1 Tax=Cytobacillus massiliigabonensis TaxID=1871011 RepID=UPI000C814CC6|nr:alpha/beta fold hydrolase [Cytobacillus massiliigabonensis]
MATYVFVHGAWHGSWCWEKVIPLFEKQGHVVLTVDLPGVDLDKTGDSSVNLRKYTDSVLRVIAKADEPVILVGHSMGGIAISQAAERHPEKIKSLIYVTAYMLKDGETMLDIIRTDKESLIAPNLIPCNEGTAFNLKSDKLIDIFYGSCDQKDIENATTRITSQPLAVFSERLSLTNDRYGKIPRYYIECLQDRAITKECQQNMYHALPCKKVFTLNTDHSPFYSKHEELAEILLHEI